jgi:hypothetical protein
MAGLCLSKAPSLCRKLNSEDYTGVPVEFLDIEGLTGAFCCNGNSAQIPF